MTNHTIELPAETVALLRKAAKHLKHANSFDDALRIAVDVGLERLNDAHGIPLCEENQFSKVHEAGHAVAYFMAQEALGIRGPLVGNINTSGFYGGGSVTINATIGLQLLKMITPEWHLRIAVAGTVAEAKARGVTFEELWQKESAEGDRQIAAQYKGSVASAARFMAKQFAKPAIWHGLTALVDYLPNKGRRDGLDALRLYRFRVKEGKK
jgi:hypothetical protein